MSTFAKYLQSGFGRFSLVLFVATGLLLSDFGKHSQPAAQAPIIKNIRLTPSAKTGMTNKDMQAVCTAAISALQDQPTAQINADTIEKGMIRLSYTDPDSTQRQYQCRIEGRKITLTREDDDGQTETSDEQVSFQLTKDEILITVQFPSGATSHSRFPR